MVWQRMGTGVWKQFLGPYPERLCKIVKQANALDGAISVNVGGKNVLKSNLVKGINEIVNCIKANYPDTYKQELRDWGFQKEKY